MQHGLAWRGGSGDGPIVWAQIRDLGSRLVPPFPGYHLVPEVRTPPLPLLNPRSTDEDRATALAKAYAGAMNRRFAGKPLIYGHRGDVTKYRDYNKLVEAAALLIDLEVSPIGWALFSMDTWLAFVPSTNPPAVAWVYSTNRIQERHDWYVVEAGAYVGGQTYISRAHSRILATYRAMEADLMRRRPKTTSEVGVIVERYFPGDLYDCMLRDAVREAWVVIEQLKRMAEDGVAW